MSIRLTSWVFLCSVFVSFGSGCVFTTSALPQASPLTSQNNVSASSTLAKVGVKSIAGTTNSPSSSSSIYTPATIIRGLTQEIREKYKENHYLILSKGQIIIRVNACDFMTDTQKFKLINSEVHADGSWKVVVSKMTTRSTLDPEMMQAGEKPKITSFPLEIWTASSSDQIETRWTGLTTEGHGVLPVDSGLARPVLISPGGAVFEMIYSAC